MRLGALDNVGEYLRENVDKSYLEPYIAYRRNAFTHQKQIDLILDKIGKSGYESLTQEEKDFLFRAGKK